ncbi:MAG TPA: hypothetical protein VNJ71_02660 [Gemmatimonadales bacterium]|jgi:hypothetical protein|nr:hypothetical protein [Gemmatimonadales bacterium]
MPELGSLPPETERLVHQIGSADLAVGIASYNHAETVGAVVAAAAAGLRRFFPGVRSAVLHADGGSRDGSAERVLQAAADGLLVQAPFPLDSAARPPGVGPGHPGRSAALRVLFDLARRLGVRGLAVVEPDLLGVTGEWIGRLLAPVFEDEADFVTPYYVRHRFGGAITNSIVYPFTRALYGKRLRYPLGGDFACSGRLVERALEQDVWHGDLARLGLLDVWLVTEALCGGFRLAQAFLGVKAQAGADGALDLSLVLSRVLGALFLEAERRVAVWQKVRGSEPVPLRGRPEPSTAEPVTVDLARSLAAFRLGQQNLHEVWGLVLPPLTLLELRKLAARSDEAFRFPDELWARIVYDFALAHRMRVMNRDHLLAAFVPLYHGWLGSFVAEMREASLDETEQRIERLCLRYESEKPYLISRWRWPDRFTP